MTKLEIQLAVDVFLGKSNIDLMGSFEIIKILSLHIDIEPDTVREAVIRVLDNWSKIPIASYGMWNDLIEAVGLYPYLTEDLLRGSTAIRYEFHRSPNLKKIIFHSEQQKVFQALAKEKSVILSAPTSFGKSLLIEDIIASNKYKNIVIVQPTLALLDETRNKLAKYRDSYNLVLSTAESPQERNIFLLTAERIVEYQNFPEIDFFVIDEFYKLSSDRDDERSTALNIAVYKLLKKTKNFYFLGPNIYRIPEGFTNKFDSLWFKSDFTTVAVDTEKITGSRGGIIKGEDLREAKLFELLESLDDQTLIYCATPKKTVDLANKYSLYIQSKDMVVNSEVSDISEWIEENIHKDWSLINSLSSGVGFHHGAIPRHLGVSIIDLFNEKKIKYLFCTSTIIEGVNTTAKNVVLFDTKKGIKPIDFFDFKNIAGRSGRMREHFVGKIFEFHHRPDEADIEVDIPFFTQTNAPLELLVHLDTEDLKTESKERLASLGQLSQEELHLLKSNFGAPLEGQIKVLNMLKTDDGSLHKLLSWKSYPSWDELEKTIEVCFNHLVFKKRGRFTHRQLAMKVSMFLKYKNIKALIEEDIKSEFNIDLHPDYRVRVQHAVESNLYLLRNWFTFILPKSLTILNELQKFVFEKKGLSVGNYSAAIYGIENRYIQENLAPLLDYSVPTSALNKISKYINPEINFENAMKAISKLDFSRTDLLDYEKKLLLKSIEQIKNSRKSM